MQHVIGARVGFVMVGSAQKYGYILYNMFRMTYKSISYQASVLQFAMLSKDLIDARFSSFKLTQQLPLSNARGSICCSSNFKKPNSSEGRSRNLPNAFDIAHLFVS